MAIVTLLFGTLRTLRYITIIFASLLSLIVRDYCVFDCICITYRRLGGLPLATPTVVPVRVWVDIHLMNLYMQLVVQLPCVIIQFL